MMKIGPFEIDRIYNMDCIEAMKQLPDGCVDLVLTDPPYNIGIDVWDKIANYEQWFMEIVKEVDRVLKDKGTFWFFHMVFRTMARLDYLIEKHTSFRHKQLIVIDKGIESIAGRCNFDSMRSLPRATEYLQFYTREDVTGSEMLSEQYAKLNPMAKYLREEFRRAGVTNKQIASLFPSKTGNTTGCVSNWLLGYNLPLQEQYEKMREYMNGDYLRREYEDLRREYEDLRREYEDLRREYEDLRYTFNLPNGVTDVIRESFYKNKIEGHKTPKPIPLMQLIITTASNKNDIILDPFVGSGGTLIGCIRNERHYIGFENNNTNYCLTNKRIEQERMQLKLEF